METALAILVVLGIYVGIPAAIGFAILGTVALSRRKAQPSQAEAEFEGKPATAERELVGAGRTGR
jgi:hypothetical protein